jgi:large subunit ribosomal protein L22
MEVKAKLKNLRIAPRKVRLVADLIRGKKVTEAERILNFTVKRAAKPILKLLNSAIANAKHNFGLEKEKLYIKKILVDEGQKFKKIFPRARGRADIIQKKSSHVTIVLDEIEKHGLQSPSKNI